MEAYCHDTVLALRLQFLGGVTTALPALLITSRGGQTVMLPRVAGPLLNVLCVLLLLSLGTDWLGNGFAFCQGKRRGWHELREAKNWPAIQRVILVTGSILSGVVGLSVIVVTAYVRIWYTGEAEAEQRAEIALWMGWVDLTESSQKLFLSIRFGMARTAAALTALFLGVVAGQKVHSPSSAWQGLFSVVRLVAAVVCWGKVVTDTIAVLLLGPEQIIDRSRLLTQGAITLGAQAGISMVLVILQYFCIGKASRVVTPSSVASTTAEQPDQSHSGTPEQSNLRAGPDVGK